jgi:hypothetical protein
MRSGVASTATRIHGAITPHATATGRHVEANGTGTSFVPK